MKKLLVIAVAMAAVAANAATFSWKTSTTGKIYEADSTTPLASATAYLFDSGKVGQAAVLSAFNAGTAISTLAYADTTSVAAGAIAQKSFDVPAGYASGDSFDGYFAIVVDDSIYIGGVESVTTPGTGNKTMTFNAKSSSQAAAFDASKGFSNAGWYAAASSGGEPVPEPTSGLLMLIGAAGLALRRKRA